MTGRPCGVVLTGGASRRMGADKAFIEIGGAPMAVHVAGALAGAGCQPVWCQGGDVAGLTALGLTARPDEHPGEGPVTAIATALRYARQLGAAGLLAAACDLPDLTVAAVRTLIDAALPDRPAALATGGQAQLVSWWPVSTEIPQSLRTYRAALDALAAELVDVEALALRNVNTPAERAAAQRARSGA